MSSSSALSSDSSEQELQAFRKALFKLCTSEMSTLAKFSKVFKKLSKKMDNSEVKWTPGENQLADVIFGVPGFPLLELPDVPRNQILRELGYAEIVKLSFLSKKMKRIVRSANYPIANLTFNADHDDYEVSGIDFNKSISVQFIDQPSYNCDQVFKVIEGMEATWEKLEDRNKEESEEYVDFIRPAGADKKTLEDFLVRHFLEVFPKGDNLIVRLYSGKLKDLYLWNVRRSIDSLYYLGVEGEQIPVEEMQFMLEEINVKKVLEIRSNVEDGYRYSTGFKTSHVSIEGDASWVDLDAIINSTSSNIKIFSYGEITRSQINNVLKLWISRERMENLTKLFVRKCVIIGDADVFDGIEVQRHRVGSDKYIVKRSDGKLARIRLRDDRFVIFMKEK